MFQRDVNLEDESYHDLVALPPWLAVLMLSWWKSYYSFNCSLDWVKLYLSFNPFVGLNFKTFSTFRCSINPYEISMHG
jgi:hypothetical protein